ncbi:MAG: lysostaphin resistance A-like protein [Microcystaceae cyanobacterium]
MTQSNPSDFDPLSRTQILIIMGVTALILLAIAKVWQWFGAIALLPWQITGPAVLGGVVLAGAIITMSGLIYRVWPAYRESADSYLQLVIKPLLWPDLIWLGLLPGLSEELLFRGIMLPAFGFDLIAVIASSLIFGVLHLSSWQQWPYVVWATLVGFFLGYTALLTGNLAIPIVAHILTNWVSSALWKYSRASSV